MKKTAVIARLLALSLVLVLALAACSNNSDGGLSGTYEAEDESVSLVFNGNNVKMVTPGEEMGFASDMELSATYKIEGDTITIEFSNDGVKKAMEDALGSEMIAQFESMGYSLDDLIDEMMAEMGTEYNKVSFAQDENTITIDGTVFTKK